MTKRSRITIGVGALTLAVVCALALWVYKENQRRELQQAVVALVQDSTARLRDALELLTTGAESRAKLEGHFTALEGNVGKMHGLDASIYPALVQAAEAYVIDSHALLRRELALHAGREALRVDIGEIDKHLRTVGTRSQDWIQQALALNKGLETTFFDYRFAAGGLEKSLHSLVYTSLELRVFMPAGAVLEEDLILATEKRLLALSTQVEQEVKNARRLPGG